MRMLFPSAEARDHVVKAYGAIEGAKQTLGRLAELLEDLVRATSARWSKERELVITRTFDAPRRLVFAAWTKPENLVQWWGPKGFTLPTCEVDFRPGGAFHFVMRGPDGKDYPFRGSYLEVVEPERIVFQGIIHEELGHQTWTTVTFADDGATRAACSRLYSFESDATRGAPKALG